MKPQFNIIISVPEGEVARVKKEVEKYSDTVSLKVVDHYSPEETQGRILLRLKSDQLDSLAQWMSAALLTLGSDAEKNRDYGQAVKYYLKGLENYPNPEDKDTAYFLHNNAGFGFNMIGDYVSGADYCKTAIEIDPARHNAYKNLGISMEGMGNYIEAAQSYIMATKTCPQDKRAYTLLKDLLAKRPELLEKHLISPFAVRDCDLIQITDGQLIPENPRELLKKIYTCLPLTEKEKAQIEYVGEFIAPPGTPGAELEAKLSQIRRMYPTDSESACLEAAKYLRETDPKLSEEESLNHAAFLLIFLRPDNFLCRPYNA
jgi:tetratricopeptide (TPR) repeat protein